MIKRITCKLGNMRKAADWVVYPAGDNPQHITIQSEHRIARFDVTTRQGVLSKNCPNGAYFHHLTTLLGATPVEIPQEVIDAALLAQPQKGEEIGGGVVIG